MHGAGPALPHVWRLRRRCRRRMVPEVRRRWRGRPLGSHRIEAANMPRSAPFNGLGCLAAGQRLMPQHEQLHLLGGSGAAQQQDQPKHLPGDHLSQPQRHPGDRAGCRSTAIRCWRACVTFWNPTGLAPPARLARPACVRTALLSSLVGTSPSAPVGWSSRLVPGALSAIASAVLEPSRAVSPGVRARRSRPERGGRSRLIGVIVRRVCSVTTAQGLV